MSNSVLCEWVIDACTWRWCHIPEEQETLTSSSMSHLKRMLWKWTKCEVLPNAGTHLVFLILCVHTLIVFVHKGDDPLPLNC